MLWVLFLTFFKIGLFTFGGGYAMISIIDNICVEKRGWITSDEMMNMVVVAESTPGPVAINCATFVGYRQKGMLGAIAATLGVILPSFGIIYGISVFLDKFLEITWVANGFRGIKIAVGILILDAGLKMLKKAKKQPFLMVILGCSLVIQILVCIFSWNFSSVCLMLVAGTVSVLFYTLTNLGREKR